MDSRHSHKLCYAAATLLSLFLCGAVLAAESEPDASIAEQRRAFESARYALEHGDINAYRQLEPLLLTYPLYPYVRHDYLRARLGQVKPEEIRTFLMQYPDTPVAPQLRRAWLQHLARQGRWKQFVEDYGDLQDASLSCYYADALIHVGKRERAWQEIDKLWLSPKSQPRECDAPFSAWRRAGKMSREKVLARMELAMDRRDRRLISYLSKYLSRSDRPWVKRWERMRVSPESELDHLATRDHFWGAKLYTYGIRRLAFQDAEAADALWANRKHYHLTHDQYMATERAVALSLAMQRRPDGSQRLAELVKLGMDDPDVRQWSVRAALWQQDWAQVLAALDSLTTQEQGEDEWLYWRARALDALDRKNEAMVFYNVASQERSYYGFMAAARINRAPNITSEPLPISDAELTALESSPAMQRVRELSELGMNIESRREWRDALARLSPHGLRVAAKMAHDWGWYDQAIIALGRSDYLDDLEVRFPTPFRDEVEAAAEQRNLDPAFIYAVMRQESAFGVNARSPVGALGLMQLMPATARITARSINERAPSKADLLQVDTNIQLGTAYLSGLLEQYDGNRFFALAAYNAGPLRVARWQSATEPIPADIWVANVTYSETREYVQRILAYTAVYEWRLGHSVKPLSEWLREAPPRVIREASDNEKKELPVAQTSMPPG